MAKYAQTSDERATGQVIRIIFDKGFGFIRSEGAEEWFFHRSAVREGWDTLQVGDQVSFLKTHGPKGARAEDVQAF